MLLLPQPSTPDTVRATPLMFNANLLLPKNVQWPNHRYPKERSGCSHAVGFASLEFIASGMRSSIMPGARQMT